MLILTIHQTHESPKSPPEMFFAKGQEIATKIHFLGHIPLPDGLGTYQGVFGNIFDQSPQFPGLLGSGYPQITKEA